MSTGFPRMAFQAVLEDLQSRFIINVPLDELATVERICFQIEQAHWFYEDFVREANPRLPSLSLKNFSSHFFAQCPLLVHWASDHEQAFSTFMEYKVRVPVCGAIILNEALDKVLLVRGWKSKSGWAFPRGKINKEEPEAECAVREVYEETGFDIRSRLRTEEFVERTMKEQRIRLYVIRGVPESTAFLTQTRKEIGDIRWFPLKDLPGYKNVDPLSSNATITSSNTTKFYMVTAFVGALKKWIVKFKRVKKHQPKTPASKTHLGVAGISASGNGGYRSQNEYESENDVPSAGVVTNLTNQDNEDWGVNTLHQATDLIKSLIGIGVPNGSQSSLASTTTTFSSDASLTTTQSHQLNNEYQYQQQQQQQHDQHQQQQRQTGYPGQLQSYAQTSQQQYPSSSQQQIQHAKNVNQTQMHQQSHENLIAQFQNARQNSFPLQGIITTPDGVNTHAMIQIIPLSANGSSSLFSPTSSGPSSFDGPLRGQTASPSRNESNVQDEITRQRESLMKLLKSGAPVTTTKVSTQKHASMDLKNVPPPPTVNRSGLNDFSEEIKSSYGGGGGGPSVKFGGGIPIGGSGGGGGGPSLEFNGGLLNILTQGGGVPSISTPVSASSSSVTTQTAPSGQYSLKTPKQSDFPSIPLPESPVPSGESVSLAQRRTSKASLSSVHPPSTSTGSQAISTNALENVLLHSSSGNTGRSGRKKSVPASPTDDDSDAPVEDFGSLKVKAQKRSAKPRRISEETPKPTRLDKSLKDPWSELQEQESNHHVQPSLAQINQHSQQYQQQFQQYSQQMMPASVVQKNPVPPTQMSLGNVQGGQNLLDLLWNGSGGTNVMSTPESNSSSGVKNGTPHRGSAKDQQAANAAASASLMDILKIGGGGGTLSGAGAAGGGGGGGVGAGFFSNAMKRNSVSGSSNDQAANADALRSILGIGAVKGAQS
ncbi:mRNA-decapping enzyme subunit 2 [Chytriomyces hyalinus]|nr:mRNA-decapping enzyme subunit 2 [Chytriomyces hyalinus]